jgi:hypothetical protein
MQLENQAYKQEAPYSTSRSNLWPMLMTYSYHRQVSIINESQFSVTLKGKRSGISHQGRQNQIHGSSQHPKLQQTPRH